MTVKYSGTMFGGKAQLAEAYVKNDGAKMGRVLGETFAQMANPNMSRDAIGVAQKAVGKGLEDLKRIQKHAAERAATPSEGNTLGK